MTDVKTLDRAFLQMLESCSNPRQRTSLERIKAACDYFDANGMLATPSAIESYCVDREWDGPKAQSIRNSKDVLKRYVELRRAGQKVRSRSGSQVPEPVIADESLRAYFRLLKEERDQAVAERLRIEAGLRLIPGIRVDDLIRGRLNENLKGLPSGQVAHPQEAREVPTAAFRAVEALFDDQRLRGCGLELFRDRIRNIVTRNVLLEKAEVQSLRLLINGSRE